MFNPIEYMQLLHDSLKATKDKYKFVTVSGIANLEGVLENARRERYFWAVDDAQDGTTVRKGGAYFERRPYTVYILGRAEYGDMAKRGEVIAEAKGIFRSILSKLIKDKLTLPMLDMERIQFYEVPPAFATGCSGLYFVFYVENPVDLTFQTTEWS